MFQMKFSFENNYLNPNNNKPKIKYYILVNLYNYSNSIALFL
jgi:hypothetical protein